MAKSYIRPIFTWSNNTFKIHIINIISIYIYIYIPKTILFTFHSVSLNNLELKIWKCKAVTRPHVHFAFDMCILPYIMPIIMPCIQYGWLLWMNCVKPSSVLNHACTLCIPTRPTVFSNLWGLWGMWHGRRNTYKWMNKYTIILIIISTLIKI